MNTLQYPPKVTIPSNLLGGGYTAKEIQEVLRDLTPRFFVSAGALYNIAECALYDCRLMFDKMPKKWHHKCMVYARSAWNNAKFYGIDKIAQEHIANGYDLWTDMTDLAQEKLDYNYRLVKVAISNKVINNTDKYTDLKTQMVYTLFCYEYALKYYNNFFRAVKEKFGNSFEFYYRRAQQKDIYLSWRKATEVFCEDIRDVLQQTEEVRRAETAIDNIIYRKNFYDEIAYEGMKINGNCQDIIDSIDKEREERKEKELGLDKLSEKYNVIKK